jgi:short-subunit dehydrogenase
MAPPHDTTAAFADRYGPLAIVAGASEGVGACAADELAARGLDLLLIARNTALLDEVAAGIRDRHGVAVRTLPLDLTLPDAVDRVLATVAGDEVGLLFYNPGAVHNGDYFLDQPLELPLRMITLNCTVPTALVHALTPAMVERRRGGVVIVGSLGCFVGSPHSAAYSAAKAYQVNLVEGLWAELRGTGVDVLEAVIGSTTTPGRARTLGVEIDDSIDMPADDVAREALDHIADGPTRVIAKLDAGIGPVAAPWQEFRAMALERMISAAEEFTQRTRATGT